MNDLLINDLRKRKHDMIENITFLVVFYFYKSLKF
jgi:hypothetical protein